MRSDLSRTRSAHAAARSALSAAIWRFFAITLCLIASATLASGAGIMFFAAKSAGAAGAALTAYFSRRATRSLSRAPLSQVVNSSSVGFSPGNDARYNLLEDSEVSGTPLSVIRSI